MRVPMMAISIWMFIAMTIFGVVGYAYVLWTQYWRGIVERQQVLLLRNSRRAQERAVPHNPAIFQSQLIFKKDASVISKLNMSHLQLPLDKLLDKVNIYKHQLIVLLRRSQLDSGNVLHSKNDERNNRYKVHFRGTKKNVNNVPSRQLLCAAHQTVKLQFLTQRLKLFQQLKLSHLFPPKELNVHYNSCAIVTNAGSLYNSNLGPEIDKHDAVLRFNNAPTKGFEEDVGSKTTIRLLNSQVVSKPEFNFLQSPLFQNITLVAWDPSTYHANLEEWYKDPDFDLFSPYWSRRETSPQELFYIFNPDMAWDAWDFLQSYTYVSIGHNPPSSGFLGILLMLNLCNWVEVYEYIPSMRLTKRCHYYDIHGDMGCTLGDWHPLASEKLMVYNMNIDSDLTVFHVGKVVLPGFSSCSGS